MLAVVPAEIQSLLGCTGATILAVDGGELVILDHRGRSPPSRLKTRVSRRNGPSTARSSATTAR